jgi:hypothetical protein
MQRCTPQAVEKYFMDMGWLLPTFHKQYWIGLNASTPASRDPAVMKDGVMSTSPGKFSWQAAALPAEPVLCAGPLRMRQDADCVSSRPE